MCINIYKLDEYKSGKRRRKKTAEREETKTKPWSTYGGLRPKIEMNERASAKEMTYRIFYCVLYIHAYMYVVVDDSYSLKLTSNSKEVSRIRMFFFVVSKIIAMAIGHIRINGSGLTPTGNQLRGAYNF